MSWSRKCKHPKLKLARSRRSTPRQRSSVSLPRARRPGQRVPIKSDPRLDRNYSVLAVLMDECPTRFYRYRSLQPIAIDRVAKTVCKNELYFAKPSSFNDPFDCVPNFSFEASEEEI